MTVVATPAAAAQDAAQPRLDYPAASLRFDWLMTFVCAWFVLGFFVDAYAHRHFLPESFWTPWHGLLYSGFLVASGVTFWAMWRHRSAGRAWRTSLPAGYWSTFVGAGTFAAGGVGDAIWHSVFGIEADVEALFSPSHLMLGIGAAMMAAGPLRAAWRREGGLMRDGWIAALPALLSLTLVFSLLTFFVQYAHPFPEVWATVSPDADGSDVWMSQAIGSLGILVHAAIFAGVVLVALRRWSLPPGSLTLVVGLNGLLMAVLEDEYRMIAVALAAGVCADVLYAALRPAPDRPGRLRAFAFALPVTLFTIYHLVLMATEGMGWSIHLWTGSAAMAGLVGVLLSFLITGFDATASEA